LVDVSGFAAETAGRSAVRKSTRRMKMSTDLELKCDVCKEPAIGVCSSGLGPVSFAYCAECLRERRQPWGALIGFGVSVGKVMVGWAKEMIETNCRYYNKTVDEFWEEVEVAEREYERHCDERQQAEREEDT
jgi:hypothetical protein